MRDRAQHTFALDVFTVSIVVVQRLYCTRGLYNKDNAENKNDTSPWHKRVDRKMDKTGTKGELGIIVDS